MLTEYSKRKQCFIQIICEAEIIRQTQEEMICVMIDQYESKIKKILSRSKLNMRFFKDPKPETKSTMFNITSVFLQTIISCKENDHVVETLVERISTTLQTKVELEVKNECRKTLIQAFEETCATGTSHRLKIIYQVITANKLESYIDLLMCMKGACKHRNVQCSTWLFEEVKDAQTILRSVMQDSCHENDLTDVEWLLENFEEEDLDLQGSVLLAYKQNHIDIVKYFTENVDDQSHLQLKYILTSSCCDNNSYLAGYLLENVDHQHFDLTFTMKKVCEKGRKDIAKLLMVKVEEKDKLDLIKAINTARQFGWKDLVELLLETSIKFERIELAKWLKSRVGDYTPTDKIVIVESGKYFGQKHNIESKRKEATVIENETEVNPDIGTQQSLPEQRPVINPELEAIPISNMCNAFVSMSQCFTGLQNTVTQLLMRNPGEKQQNTIKDGFTLQNWYNQSSTVDNATISHSGIQENCVSVNINKGAISDDFTSIDIVSSSLQRQIIDAVEGVQNAPVLSYMFAPNAVRQDIHRLFVGNAHQQRFHPIRQLRLTKKLQRHFAKCD
ncbi:unnamed protein product [Mytilus coruscus]|uniref:Uncharacterized protein n=1 Tax=Mytilus coruscus TaxID=42192 RepID=A0A6J8D4Q8_MYTCO|nr:unnamed protein product [Mytilus coruscus]